MLLSETEVLKAIEIAVSYTVIDPAGLYSGCLSPDQSHDVAQRVLAQFHANGWGVCPIKPSKDRGMMRREQ
jgi:hypothetical protein